MNRLITLLLVILFLSSCNYQIENQKNTGLKSDPLPSWADGPAKKAIISFISETTDTNNPDFIPEDQRIAVFDNDGTLWSEKPMYNQFSFSIDRIKALASSHPEWNEVQPFKAAIQGDLKTVMNSGVEGLITLTMASHAGMTTDEFSEIVRNWIDTAHHPVRGKLYKDMVYKPMLEVLKYFRANGFKTYIVSGGGIDFMRPWTEEVYGIPPEQVVGSSIKTKFVVRDGVPEIIRLPEINFIDDKEGKPLGIDRFIGRRPVAAFGNSDGDLQMLEWTAAGKGKSLMVFIHHTDAEREWAYDRESAVGKLDKGLDEAASRSWTVVDMKNDWKVIFP